jgi:hypothetical protein
MPLFLKRVGVRGREKTLFPGKEVFPFPENRLPLLRIECQRKSGTSAIQIVAPDVPLCHILISFFCNAPELARLLLK